MEDTERLIILGKLSAALAHEIKNPLAGISISAQMLNNKMDKADPRKEYVLCIENATIRLNRVIKDILSFARPFEPYLQLVRVEKIIDSALVQKSDRLSQQGMTVEVEASEELPPIKADVDHLSRAFSHIIDNAIDAMQGGGELKIVAQAVEGKSRAGRIQVDFIDMGKGPEIDDMLELFSPFYTTKAQGIGLGLAVAKKVVEGHGGDVTCRPNSTAGMTVRVMLEATDLAKMLSKRPSKVKRRRRGSNITADRW